MNKIRHILHFFTQGKSKVQIRSRRAPHAIPLKKYIRKFFSEKMTFDVPGSMSDTELEVLLGSVKTALQKLKYIHNNPLAEHWQLAKHPCDYKYSSAIYYELNDKSFNFLKNLWELF